ncbi:hypothetical protein IFM89_011747 [Coptis chinensis]|uniref:Uncharacterized protein n=1 Tax=Coptis chinensis TaxID=261450 RepID=A0A835IWI5_9MAGN|nr:hypothetical protein IFM89_011747 [Coptis chinensis]
MHTAVATKPSRQYRVVGGDEIEEQASLKASYCTVVIVSARDNTYVVDSGGDPNVIPKLTFEEFQFADSCARSFSMYAVTLSSGLFLLAKPAMATSVAAAGVILGWPFSVMAVLPVTFYCLKRSVNKVFLLAATTSVDSKR